MSQWVLVLICLIYFVVYLDRVDVATAAGAIRHEFRLSNTQLGLVFSSYSYPYAALQLFGGWIADRLGPRLTLGLFGALFTLATIGTGLAGSFVSLTLARSLVGGGEGPALAVATRAIADWVPRERWSFAQGLAHACSRVSNAVAAPLVAYLILLVGWRGAFLCVGGLSAGWVALWVWYYRDRPADHPSITGSELAALPPPKPIRRSGDHSRTPFLRLFRRMLPVILTDFCYGWTLFVVLNWLPSFFRGAFHFDLSRSALFTSGIFAAGIAGDLAGGMISERVLRRTGSLVRARRDVIAAGLTASAACYSVLLMTHNIYVVTAALVLGFFCMELVVAPLWAVPMDITPQHAGTASGFMNFGAATAGIASPVAFGAIVDATGNWNLPFAFTVIMMVCGAALAFLMRPERPFKDLT